MKAQQAFASAARADPSCDGSATDKEEGEPESTVVSCTSHYTQINGLLLRRLRKRTNTPRVMIIFFFRPGPMAEI